MKRNSYALLVLATTLTFANAVSAKSQSVSANSPIKTYTLHDLRRVVTNSPQCKPYYNDLKELAKKPISLQLAKTDEKGKHAAKDLSGRMSHHTHTTIKQNAKSNVINRIGMGSFKYKNENIDYVITISGNLDHEDHQYLYPVIFASHDAHCYYTALVKPSQETVESFKQHIRSGKAARGADLSQK